MEIARSQEFTLPVVGEPGGHSARSFASSGVQCRKARQVEIEDYQVNLATVSILELAISPISRSTMHSQPLARWRMI